MSNKNELSPYVGLVPFHEGQEKYFFGREDDEELIATNLRASPLTVLYGASGVGKSSVIQAGVIPYLRELSKISGLSEERPNFLPVVIRDWVGDPFVRIRSQLADTVKAAAANGTIGDRTNAKIEAAKLQDKIGRDVPKLIESWAQLGKIKFLFIFDQFEEFLRPEFFEKEKDFVDGIAKAINNPLIPAHFLISMRDDALSRLDLFQGKLLGSMNNMLRLKALSRNAAEDAIRKPLKQWIPEFSVESDLVDEVLWKVRVGNIKLKTQGQGGHRDLNDEISLRSSGNYLVETPYLQIVLQRLWEDSDTQATRRLSKTTLEKLGGKENPVEQLIEKHLDEVFKQLSHSEQATLSKFIHYTVPREGTKIISTPAGLADWARMPKQAEEIEEILSQMTTFDPPIFRPIDDGDSQTKSFTVVHDALGPAMLSWRSRFNESQTTLNSTIIKNVRRFAPIVFLIFLSVLGIAGWQYWERRKKDARDEGLQATYKAIKEDGLDGKDSLISATSRLILGDESEKQSALDALNQLNSEGEISDEVKQKIVDLASKTDNADEVSKVKDVLQTTNPQPQQLRPKIFIHIKSDSQRIFAVEVRKQLVRNFEVPSKIEIPPTYPDGVQTQVRYFHQSDSSVAAQVAQQMTSLGLQKVSSVPVLRYSGTVPNNQLEIWFAADAFNQTAQVSDTINLRSSPDSAKDNVLSLIPQASIVNRRLCLPAYRIVDGKRGRWCEVTYADRTGWIFDYWLVYPE